MNVKEVMTENPACCAPETSLEEVAQMMCDYDCGEIPVVENTGSRVPVGVITDRDITCRTVARGLNPLHMKAEDCMTRDYIWVHPDASLDDCCELLEEYRLRRLLVVDEEGRCCGIVSQADIARRAPEEKVAEVLQEVSRP